MAVWLLALLLMQARTAIQNSIAEYEKTLAQPGIWTEVTAPHIEIRSVRFPCRGLAVVKAVESQYGSLIIRRMPVTIVLQQVGARWRIESYRAARGVIMMP